MASILNVDQINNAAGTSAITIDSSGNTLMPGHVVQFVYSPRTNAASGVSGSTSTSFIDSGVSATITPTSSSSIIYGVVTFNHWWSPNTATDYMVSTIYRNGTNIAGLSGSGPPATNGGAYNMQFFQSGNPMAGYNNGETHDFKDSPASTSALTYSLYLRCYGGSAWSANWNSQLASMTLMEIAQ